MRGGREERPLNKQQTCVETTVVKWPTMFFHLPKTSLFGHAYTDRPHSPEVQLPMFVLQRHGWNHSMEAVLNEHQLRELTSV